jgi:hypothetical protein
MDWPARCHWYWGFVPVAVTVSVTRIPAATVVSAAGWVVIAGAITLLPELLDEEELELDDDDELELLEEEDEEELVEPELVPPDDELEDELELLEEPEEELEEDEELELLLELLDGVVTLMAVVLALMLPAAS